MALMSGLAIAGAGVLGDVISSQGQQSTNEAQAAIASQNNATAMMLAQNAMQYRVKDLRAAGLNPMLAVGTQGAAVPNLQQPNLQNPSAAFANTGAQVAQAAQTQANVRATNAQAALTESQTPSDDVIPVDSDGHISSDAIMSSPHGGMLGKLNAAQMMADISKTNATVDNLVSSTNVNRTINDLRGVDLNVARQSAASVVQKAVNDANLGSADVSIEQARAKVLGGPMGPAIQAIESVLGGGFLGQVLNGAISRASAGGTVTKSIIGAGGQYRGGSVTTTGR